MSEPEIWTIKIADHPKDDFVRLSAYKALDLQRAELMVDYARLKAEVERLKGIILAQSSDFVRSKTADDGIKPEGHNDLAGRAVEHCLKLQTENERLRKAGDIVLLALWLGVDEYSKEQKEKAEQEWEKAKEGKQS